MVRLHIAAESRSLRSHFNLPTSAACVKLVALDAWLQEYIASKDLTEAAQCLRKLAVPFYHHEVVKQSLLMAVSNSTYQAAILELLSSLSASGQISTSQLSRVRLAHWNAPGSFKNFSWPLCDTGFIFAGHLQSDLTQAGEKTGSLRRHRPVDQCGSVWINLHWS